MREWLREIRGDRSQLDIANLCGISHQMYNFIENGHRRPSVKVAKRLGEALGFDWTRLFAESESVTVDELLRNTGTTS